MKGLTTTGARIIFGIPFLIFGIFHFMNASQMAGFVPFPPEKIWVYLTGVAHILAAVAFIINQKVKLAALLLSLMLLIFILAVHLPAVIGGEGQQAQTQMQAILKNLGLIGGALAVAGLQVLQEEENNEEQKGE